MNRFHVIKPDESGKRPVQSDSPAEGEAALITNAQCRGKLENVSADKDLVFDPVEPVETLFGAAEVPEAIELQINHPSYSFNGGASQLGQGITLRSLRDQTAKAVLVKK